MGCDNHLGPVPRRYWRLRADPFIDVWDTEVVPLLKGAPKLMAITLLRKLQDDYPARFPDGMLRTLQRHVRQWLALEGPSMLGRYVNLAWFGIGSARDQRQSVARMKRPTSMRGTPTLRTAIENLISDQPQPSE